MESEMKAVEGPKSLILRHVALFTMEQSPDSKYYLEEENGLPFLQGYAEFGARFPKYKTYCSHIKKLEYAWSIHYCFPNPLMLNRKE